MRLYPDGVGVEASPPDPSIAPDSAAAAAAAAAAVAASFMPEGLPVGMPEGLPVGMPEGLPLETVTVEDVVVVEQDTEADEAVEETVASDLSQDGK